MSTKSTKHLSFESQQQLAEVAARDFIFLVQQKQNEPFTIALSGGRIAQPFYQAIVDASATQNIPWNNVHFFWADERCVPPDSKESNFLDARLWLLSPLEIPNENIHRIYGETEDDYAVSQAEAELCRVCTLDEEGMPILDLAILGMGEDGHTASLFPSEPESMVDDERVFRAVTATKPPPKRVTMSYQVLIRAREAMVLVSGSGKKPMLEQVLNLDPKLPLSRVIKRRSRTTFYTCLA